MNKAEFLGVTQVPFAERYDNFIGGKWVAPVAGKYFENTSPITGKVVCEVARSDAQDIEAALDAAHAAKDAWGRTAPAERAAHPEPDRRPDGGEPRAARPRRDLGQRQADPRDAPPPTSRSPSTISAISPAASARRKARISEIDHDTVAYHFHEPLGVVGQIIPWNFPILMAVLEARARRSPPAIASCSSPPSRRRPRSWSGPS